MSKADIAWLLTVALLVVRNCCSLSKHEGLERTFCLRLWHSEQVFMTLLLLDGCRLSIFEEDNDGGSIFLQRYKI